MERISRDNAALCLIDHQTGLLTGVRDIALGELKHNVVALAKAAQILGLPVILATTAKDELWGPTVPELVAALNGDYAKIDRMTVNAWDDPAFVGAVKKTGRSHLICRRRGYAGLRRLPRLFRSGRRLSILCGDGCIRSVQPG